jgi:hypothetical protein
MPRDFQDELRKRLAAIDKGRPIYEKIKEEKLFNIHKRSLPVGIDKKIVFRVTKEDAEWWVEKRLKAHSYQDDSRDTKTLIYYDIIPIGATPREKSIYFNKGPITREEI